MNTLVHHRSHHALIWENSRNKSKDKNHQKSVTQYKIIQMIRTICIRLIRRAKAGGRQNGKSLWLLLWCLFSPSWNWIYERMHRRHARENKEDRRTVGKMPLFFESNGFFCGDFSPHTHIHTHPPTPGRPHLYTYII